MAATYNQVQGWISGAKLEKAKYLIVVCDEFDYTDYPVYVMDENEIEEKTKYYNDRSKMRHIMEIIKIDK